MRYREADLSRVKTIPVAGRRNKVDRTLLAAPPDGERSFADFLASLPDVLAARDLRAVIAGVAAAHRARRGVILLVGGHVIKVGLGPLINAWLARGIITHVALNGAAAIHDFELAAFGGTSEDVEAGLIDGTFGMAEETGAEMNAAIVAAAEAGQGLGEGLARALGQRAQSSRGPGRAEAISQAGERASGPGRLLRGLGPLAMTEQTDAMTDQADQSALPGAEASVLLGCLRHGVPVTVHVAIGADIIHQHPSADGAAIGATTYRDFRRLAGSVPDLDQGGAVLNWGSAVLLPEVFLKALTIARNLDGGRPTHFLAADFDMQRHYRPRVNVVQRPTQAGGSGHLLTGHHELLIPLLVWGVLETLDS